MTYRWIVLLLGAAACQSSTALPPNDAGAADAPNAVVDLLHPGALCAAPAGSDPLPLDVKFSFRNSGMRTLFLPTACVGTDFSVSSCASGFTDTLGPNFHCACQCGDTKCKNVSCGACYPPDGVEVSPGASQQMAWPAVLVTDEVVSGQTCVTSKDLPAATYRVAVRVFDTKEGAAALVGGRVVTKDFVLTTTSQPVMVSLEDNGSADCEPADARTLAACTVASSREQGCRLTDRFTFSWQGGNRSITESFQLIPPATIVMTRSNAQVPNMGQQECAALVPVCSMDARVVVTSEIVRAMAEPAVVAAFADPVVVYGQDPRPTDGAILMLHQADGKSLAIGGPCTPPNQFCARSLLPGMANLAALLTRLADQTRHAPTCSALSLP